jgi:hypothetical protein
LEAPPFARIRLPSDWPITSPGGTRAGHSKSACSLPPDLAWGAVINDNNPKKLDMNQQQLKGIMLGHFVELKAHRR